MNNSLIAKENVETHTSDNYNRSTVLVWYV